MALWCRKLYRLLDALRVETQGKYSAQRVIALAKYHRETSVSRRVAVLMLTPAPCVAIAVLQELIPLDPPYEGALANTGVYGRGFFMLTVFSFLIFYQFSHYLPTLPSSLTINAIQSVIVGLATTAAIFATGCLWGFPVPFTIIVMSPVWIGLEFAAMGVLWGSTARQHLDELRQTIKGAVIVWLCQITLVSIYPVYYFVYSLLSHTGRAALALFVPVLKLAMRVLFNHSVTHLQDELPEVVVLNVEVFNALFMMYCMQITPSLTTTACLMAIDAAQSTASLFDVNGIAREINFATGPTGSAVIATKTRVRHKSFLDKAAGALAGDIPRAFTRRNASFGARRTVRPGSTRRLLFTSSRAKPRSYTVLPGVSAGRVRVQPAPDSSRTGSSLVTDDGSVDAVRRLLYVSEFLMLLNYVELVVPAIYATYLSAVYHLPNRQYFSHVAGMSDDQLRSTLTNVLLYASLELLSLLTLHTVLKRKFRLPGLAQLAFVLEKQCGGVQMKLIFFALYNAQPSLQHLGFDYTFQFEWLHQPRQ